jgi:glycerate kinase
MSPSHSPSQEESSRHVLIVPDKFRSTATASELRDAMVNAADAEGFIPTACAISDGGEGLLEALGGEARTTTVTGPLGERIDAEWRILTDQSGGRRAVIEMARASGLALIASPMTNNPLRASTRGTGELIVEAINEGATTIIVGCGGSATTDGGRGALEAIGDLLPREGVTIKVACDVTTTFIDAAKVFGPQKGATPDDVVLLTERLRELAQFYSSRYGIDVTDLPRSGAAGGLAGGLAALGGDLVSGVTLVGDEIGLDYLISTSDLVITGEGRLDDTSFTGKVVGELLERTRTSTPLLIIVGEAVVAIDHAKDPEATIISLVDRFGNARALTETVACVELATREMLRNFTEWSTIHAR